MSKHVLIAGASGVVGRAARDVFTGAGWEVTTLSRSQIAPGGKRHLSADLLKPESLDVHRKTLRSITHLYYAALKPSDNPGVEADENAAMLENLVGALRAADAPLARITVIQGGKLYGAHLGTYKTPAREEDSRHFPPNLYFRHEDFVRGTGIPWTALRPDIVIGHSLGSSMNLGNLIGLYGALCREAGTAMQYPGTFRAYHHVLANITDQSVLGAAAARNWKKSGARDVSSSSSRRTTNVLVTSAQTSSHNQPIGTCRNQASPGNRAS